MTARVSIVIECAAAYRNRVCYVFDSLFLAAGLSVAYLTEAPPEGPWVFYGTRRPDRRHYDRCVGILHEPSAWDVSELQDPPRVFRTVCGLAGLAHGSSSSGASALHVPFDLVASAFYFLSSCSERSSSSRGASRGLYEQSVFSRCQISQTIVDEYLELLLSRIDALTDRLCRAPRVERKWPGEAAFGVVLSHDIDFLARGQLDTVRQAFTTVLRHLVKQRDIDGTIRGVLNTLRALGRGQDPYADLPGMILREKSLGVRASYQVAVGHRHPDDVNYYIHEEAIRKKLAVIVNEGFEVALHGSILSTNDPAWYAEEVVTLSRGLATPTGARQHFLSFDYDGLFRAQENAGIQFDMSMGFPDRLGPRAGFSWPYFPYCIREDRPYRVLEIGLSVMDVTLRSYMRLKGEEAWRAIDDQLQSIARRRGCSSVVWHPIVFGGARDPGMDDLFWRLVRRIKTMNGIATDGCSINAYIRSEAAAYGSFSAWCLPACDH